jgi:hypothetical protein
MEIQALNEYQHKDHTIGLPISIKNLPEKININGDLFARM